MILAISYESSNYYRDLQNRLNEDLNRYRIPHREYNQQWLREQPFYREHRDILDCERGAGYWVWKPYIIRRAMDTVQENDIVNYMDSSTTLRSDPKQDIDSVQDVWICSAEYINKDWIKKDCFHMMGCDEEIYYNGKHCWAGTICVRNTLTGKFFVDEWLRYCCDKRIISDDPNVSGENYPGFRDHRHDQAILSILAIKHILVLRTPGIEYKLPWAYVDQ